MFTGIITACAQIKELQKYRNSLRLGIVQPKNYTKIKLGESIAINGCCLTVVACQSKQLHFDVSEESLAKTNLGKLKKGDVVNLERALLVSDRLGGHIVQGHVDGIGQIKKLELRKDGDNIYHHLEVIVPKELSRYLVAKGSVSLDGISLTVNKVIKNVLFLYIIPHTYNETNLKFRKVGDALNVEVDILAKYIEKLVCSSL